MKKINPHIIWIIGILILIIILLIAYIIVCKLPSSDLIISYVSCASILLSIALSILAIQYTYTSNAYTQRQFEKINAAATMITTLSNKLAATENKINESMVYINNRLDSIDRIQKEIKNSQIPSTNIPTNH